MRWARGYAALALLASAATAGPATADEDEPKPRVIDPGVAIGPYVAYTARPAPSPDIRACSTRYPLCVHTLDPSVLAAFERAWAGLAVLGVPSPDPSPDSLAYDVFAGEETNTFLEARDMRSRVDRARAFTLADRRLRPGCHLDAAAATALARASLFRVAPATEEATARAQSTYLAELVVPCAVAFATDTAATFQSQPGRAFANAYVGDVAVAGGMPHATNGTFTAGASMFWRRLDWAYSRSIGGMVTASWALHPTMTATGASRFVNEPDTFDVLRVTFKNALATKSTVDDLWLDFAVARAFAGTNDDGFHMPELATLGDAAKVPLDWDIPWPTGARRLAPRSPVEPTGASYVLIHHDGARPEARLRVELEWEQHALFRWTLVKLDRSGRELGRVPIPAGERATAAQITLVDLAGVDRILLVGAEVGDPAYAFDPDDEVWEPHAWLVTVAEE